MPISVKSEKPFTSSSAFTKGIAMNKKQKPSTSLPWEPIKLPGHYGVVNEQDLRVCESQDSEDAAYIVHAANAYPKLVEALQSIANAPATQPEAIGIALAARSVLRELGEAE